MRDSSCAQACVQQCFSSVQTVPSLCTKSTQVLWQTAVMHFRHFLYADLSVAYTASYAQAYRPIHKGYQPVIPIIHTPNYKYYKKYLRVINTKLWRSQI